MTLPIIPIPAFPEQAIKLRVDDGHILLNESANFQWTLLNSSDVVVAGPGRTNLSPEQYAQWGSDDSWPIQCVAANIGVVLAN